MRTNFLRPIHYHGDDTGSAVASRETSQQLKRLSDNPLLGGALFELQDYSALTGTVTQAYPLRHQLHAKANGVMVLECRPKEPGHSESPTYPVHVPAQDTDDVAFVAMTPYMALNFLWSFWVW
jgi:hypothetical protein